MLRRASFALVLQAAGAPVALATSPSDVVARIQLGGQPCGVAGAGGAVWVSDAQAGVLHRVDPATNAVTKTIAIGRIPCEMRFAAGALWIVTQTGKLVRVDPVTGRVVKRIAVGITSTTSLRRPARSGCRTATAARCSG